jgi:hypothetical protein
MVSKRAGLLYRSDLSKQWIKIKNPAAPAVRREPMRIGREAGCTLIKKKSLPDW